MPSAVLGVGKRGRLPTILESRNPVFCRGFHLVLNDLLRLQLLPAEFLFLSAGGGGQGGGGGGGGGAGQVGRRRNDPEQPVMDRDFQKKVALEGLNSWTANAIVCL